ncbi:PAS domain-containing protein [Streptomyces sp. MAR4 CNX-425]|uniref:PAS domain-containing protein n=1 Tax=Streptomyces sp. MAR4 CNX-425 TaxID=3406343 RepID=UPI003B50331D
MSATRRTNRDRRNASGEQAADAPDTGETAAGSPPAAADATAGDAPPPVRAAAPDLLAALLDGMDAALCAFDADGVVTHWNREAEQLLGWTAAEAVGRRGLAGWAARAEDAADVEARLLGAMDAPGRQVQEFALLRKDGGRVLVRTQTSAVRTGSATAGAADSAAADPATGDPDADPDVDPDGGPAAAGAAVGVYCAFSEVHAQLDLERSIAFSEALCEDAAWGVLLVDADLRPALANGQAARVLRARRSGVLGRPFGELLEQGVEEVESALRHVLAQGSTAVPADVWVTVRGETGGDPAARRRCLRGAFVRLASPLAEHPVPLGVGWLFQDVTEAKLAEDAASVLRFRDHQLHRASRAAAECEDPMEAATVYLDFALAGFADHALVDLAAAPAEPGTAPPGPGGPHDPGSPPGRAQLTRAAATPAEGPGPCLPAGPHGFPVRYPAGHPALQAVERGGTVRAGCGGVDPEVAEGWSVARKWPPGTMHALCAVLRSRGRTLGVVTFLRGGGRRGFTRQDAAYAEDVAVRVAASLDLAELLG